METKTWKNSVLFVTNGERAKGADPHLTDKGRKQVTSLRKSILFGEVGLIAIGTGNRHAESAMALDIEERQIDAFDAIVGNPDSGDPIGDPTGQWHVTLANGRVIPLEKSTQPTKAAVLAHLTERYGNVELPAGKTVVLLIGGRPMLEALQVQHVTSGALYWISSNGASARIVVG